MAQSGILIDVDNTLYPVTFDTEPLFIEKIIEFIQYKLHLDKGQAVALHETWHEKGMSDLNGIVKEYGVSPKEFMEYVCAIDMSFLQEDPDLCKQLQAIPLQKYIYTDSSVGHAKDVCARLGILNCFSGFFSPHEGGYTCKKQKESVERILKYFNLDAKNSWLIDDLPDAVRNAKSCGLRTIQIDGNKQDSEAEFVAPDIISALKIIQSFNI